MKNFYVKLMTKANLLLVLFLLGTGTVISQNLITNGDFEDDTYTTFEKEGETFPLVIKGFDVLASQKTDDFNNVGLNMYNVNAKYEDHTEDSPLIEEGNTAFLKMKRYEWNGWGDGGVQVTIPVTAGKTYDLSCIYAGETISKRPNSWDGGTAGDVGRYIRIHENELDWEHPNTNKVFEESIPDARTINWTKYETSYTASSTATKLIVSLVLIGSGSGGSGMNDVWFGVDNVVFQEKTGSTSVDAIGAEKGSVYSINQEIILADFDLGTSFAIYNMQGQVVRMGIIGSDNDSISLQNGIYIVSIGNKSYKAVVN